MFYKFSIVIIFTQMTYSAYRVPIQMNYTKNLRRGDIRDIRHEELEALQNQDIFRRTVNLTRAPTQLRKSQQGNLTPHRRFLKQDDMQSSTH